MEYTNLNIRTSKSTKAAAEKIFEELGINTSAAFNIFLKAVIRENGLPFNMKIEKPNSKTIKAIANSDANEDVYGPFDSVEDLMKDLNA